VGDDPVELVDGKLTIGGALSGLSLRIRLEDRVLSGPLRADGDRFTLEAPGVSASLELIDGEAVVALLHYQGPALAAERGIELVLTLDRFAHALALKRIKMFWTAPVMVSDVRLLAPDNLFLLWQQTGEGDHHLILPLAGDGMVGAVGHESFELRVALGSGAPGHAPSRVPLFAWARGADPFALPERAMRAGFAAGGAWGRLRRDKRFPAPFESLGWCSWNAYYHGVTEDKLMASARSLARAGLPIGFFLVDDGWLTLRDRMLAGYDADPDTFPSGLAGLAAGLRRELGPVQLGVWHALQGHWGGVDPQVFPPLLAGLDGQSIPGRGFYDEWYRRLVAAGYQLVKVDNQSASPKFIAGLLPLYDAGAGIERDQQEAAEEHRLEVLACMSMSLECAFNFRHAAIARNSDDYIPDDRRVTCEHLMQNAYNALWTAAFAWPDWDMFQSHDADGLAHAIARAMSGGPIYLTDEPGRERVDIIRPLCDSGGRLYRLDEPGVVTRDLLYRDPSLGAGALKVWGRITRPGLRAGAVAALRVDKAAAVVSGELRAGDVEGMAGARVAVWQRQARRAFALGPGEALPFSIGEPGVELFTLAEIEDGVAVLGLLDAYLGPAAVTSVSRAGGEVLIDLRGGGELAVWLDDPAPPLAIVAGGAPAAHRVDGNLLLIEVAAGPVRVRIR
jgi:raffinose synthase